MFERKSSVEGYTEKDLGFRLKSSGVLKIDKKGLRRLVGV